MMGPIGKGSNSKLGQSGVLSKLGLSGTMHQNK